MASGGSGSKSSVTIYSATEFSLAEDVGKQIRDEYNSYSDSGITFAWKTAFVNEPRPYDTDNMEIRPELGSMIGVVVLCQNEDGSPLLDCGPINNAIKA
ncbi:hypothetical protein GGI16_005314, partial [Coemansia sp. S142-1]